MLWLYAFIRQYMHGTFYSDNISSFLIYHQVYWKLYHKQLNQLHIYELLSAKRKNSFSTNYWTWKHHCSQFTDSKIQKHPHPSLIKDEYPSDFAYSIESDPMRFEVAVANLHLSTEISLLKSQYVCTIGG